MARYTADSKERVRDAIDFVALVGARTELRRSGPGRYMGRCPFHEERTPSFSINADEKFYKCFGCGVAGDVFTFAMETEGLDFVGALEWLADRAGVTLERESEDPEEERRRRRLERLLEILERCTAYYERVLWTAPDADRARAYLAGRGLQEEALRRFRVGFAPSPWDRVLVASRRAGFSEEELRAAGVVQRGENGRVYDRFRARIIFPLADARGKVRGFGARALGESSRGPKYLNSSDGEVFHKGKQVYAADLARRAAAREGTVILAEGYTDVIALAQAGMENAVGLMGTALTADQVTELARLAPTVLLCLDADAAGQDAMLRAAQVAAGRRLSLRVVPLPPGDDPADLIARDGPDRMRELLAAAVPFARFRVDRALAVGDLSGAEGRDRVLSAVRPVIGAVADPLLRGELVQLVASRLSLSEGITERLIEQARPPAAAAGGGAAASGGSGRGGVTVTVLDRRERAERSFLALCIALPDDGERRLREIDLATTFASPLTHRAAAYLRDHVHSPAAALPDDDPELATLVAELSTTQTVADPTALEIEALQLAYLATDRAINAAMSEGREGVLELVAERDRLRERWRRLSQSAGPSGPGGEFAPRG